MLRRLQLISETLDAIGLGYVLLELMEPEGDRLRLIDVNDAASHVSGIDVRSLVGLPIDDSMPSVRAAGLVTPYAAVARGAAARQFESVPLPIPPMEGQIFRITAFPVEKNIVGVAFENVTESVRALEKIHFQSVLLDAVGQAVASVDLDGRITYWNGHAEHLYGWTAAEAMGRYSSELVGPAADEIHRRVFDGEVFATEAVVANRFGDSISASVTGSPIRNSSGTIVGCVGTAIDLTEQRRAEAAARDNDRRMHALLEAVPDGILRLTLDGLIIDARRSLEPLPIPAGTSLQEIAARRLTPASREALAATFHRAVTEGGLQTTELELLSEGGVRNVEARLVYPGGDEVLAIFTDVTDRVNAIRAAERRNVGLDLHDQLGQSLTALKFSLETAARTTAAAAPDLRAAARRVAEIIGDVRNVSQALREGAIPRNLFAELESMIRLFAKDAALEIDFAFDGDESRLSPEVRTAVFRIVQEAITNIARHAKTQRAAVSFSAQRDHVLLEVKDRGAGFDVTEVSERQTGGLAGITERVQRIGGALVIRSTPDAGTEIEVRLPLSRGDEA